MSIEEVETIVIHQFDIDILVHDLTLCDDIEHSWQMHHCLKSDYLRLSIWQLTNQPNTSIAGWKRYDPIVSLHILHIRRVFSVGDEHWLMAGDVSHASAIDKPFTGSSNRASRHPIVLERRGESRSGLCRWYCCCVSSLWKIATFLAQAILGDMPSPFVKKALPLIIVFPIVLIIFFVPHWTVAASSAFTAFATLLCKERSFWREPILSVDCSFPVDELGDDLIRCGGHCGIIVRHELQEDFPLVVPWDATGEIEDVLLCTYLGDCLCICVGVGVSSVSASGRCCCRYWAEIVIIDCPINLHCIGVDISAVL